MSKILWVDFETTGMDETRHGICQIGLLVQQDGKIVHTEKFDVNPGNVEYDPEALAIHGLTKEQIQSFEDEFIVFPKFMAILDEYVDRYNKGDKFIFGGFNCKFDFKFLKAWMHLNGEDYIMSYFWSGQMDVQTLATYATMNLRVMLSYSLKGLCALFDIVLDDAHDALADIVATYKLFKVLQREHIPISEN